MGDKTISGPVNAVAPEGVTMATLAASIGRVLGRPSWIPVPAAVLKLLLGEMSEVVLEGARIHPERLSRAGFEYRFPDLNSALTDLLR
jgi:NAD dependent epimerase/dehydratase family enzyme